MLYRTRVYIAGAWDEDFYAINKIKEWNDKNCFGLNFTDAHDLTQARDTSLNCSIKKSLALRLSGSKAFVLVVGDQTNSVSGGGCQYCNEYASSYKYCRKGGNVDFRSYIQFECENAVRSKLKILVLYNNCKVDRTKCPEVLRFVGEHLPMQISIGSGKSIWNASGVCAALKRCL